MDLGIDVARVARVYSGKKNRCCCGCSGKYYEVGEADPKTIRKIFGKILSGECTDEGGHVWSEIGDRLYIAYYKEAA